MEYRKYKLNGIYLKAKGADKLVTEKLAYS